MILDGIVDVSPKDGGRAATEDNADSLRLVVTQKGEVTLQIINLVLVEVRFRA